MKLNQSHCFYILSCSNQTTEQIFDFRYVLMQSPQFLYYSIHFLNYCYFLHHGGDISHSVCFFLFLYCQGV